MHSGRISQGAYIQVSTGGQAANRYYTLDAVRGIAAIAVAAGHVGTWFGVHFRFWLAVDLFFLMSGFVLADAYGRKLDQGLGAMRFMALRYLRLYPLYLLGTLFSLASIAASMALGHGKFTDAQLPLAIVTGLLMLPSPLGGPGNVVFPINQPGWSLFFELVANLVFALFWKALRPRVLFGLVLAAGLWLALAHAAGHGFEGPYVSGFFWAFPRVLFSFFLGVLLARYVPRRRVQTNWAWLLIAALGAIFVHQLPGGALLDALTVFLVLPAFLVAALVFEPKQRGLCEWLGAISYPLYAIHFPLEMFVERAFHAVHLEAEAAAPLSGIVTLAVALGCAWALDRYYDAKVRRWASRRLMPRKATAVPAV